MPPNKLQIPIAVKYRKLLEEFHSVQKELETKNKEVEKEKQLRLNAELKVKELEKESNYPEHLRVDRIEAENKALKSRERKIRERKKSV